jgi:hypothetical protein
MTGVVRIVLGKGVGIQFVSFLLIVRANTMLGLRQHTAYGPRKCTAVVL